MCGHINQKVLITDIVFNNLIIEKEGIDYRKKTILVILIMDVDGHEYENATKCV